MVRVTRAGQGRELLGHPYPLAPSGWADAGQPSGGDPAGEAAPGQVAINPSLPPPAQLAPPPDPPTHVEHPEILPKCHILGNYNFPSDPAMFALFQIKNAKKRSIVRKQNCA